MFKKAIIGILTLVCLILIVCSVAKNEQPVKTWKIPDHMTENLNYMINDFNRRFEARITQYKDDLRTNFRGYEDLPDDAVLDLQSGVFIDRADYVRLVQEAQAKQAEKEKAQQEQKK